MTTNFNVLLAEIEHVIDLIDIASERARQEAHAAGINVMDLIDIDGRRIMEELIHNRTRAETNLAIVKLMASLEEN